MECTQGRFLLLGLVLLLEAICTIDGSLRPDSVAEIREVLVFGPRRDIRKEVEEGVLLPPFLPGVRVRDETWFESENLVRPVMRPSSVPGHLFYGPMKKLALPEGVRSEHKEGDATPMPYVESSQFRNTNPQAQFTPSEIYPAAKKFAWKPAVLDVPKAQFSKALKIEKFAATRKASELNQNTATGDAPDKMEFESQSDSSHSLLLDEMSVPFDRLPSNEEYDRNSRFTHSILYGFNADI